MRWQGGETFAEVGVRQGAQRAGMRAFASGRDHDGTGALPTDFAQHVEVRAALKVEAPRDFLALAIFRQQADKPVERLLRGEFAAMHR